MAWTTPKTFLPEDPVTVADLNTYLRDNLNTLAAAQATEAGLLVTTDGLNEVALRKVQSSTATATVTTTSTTPTTLGGGTPTVTVEHSGAVWVLWAARMRATSGTGAMSCAPEVVGEGDFAAVTGRNIMTTTNGYARIGGDMIYYGLPAGTDEIRLNYWVDAATTGEYGDRTITAIPL